MERLAMKHKLLIFALCSSIYADGPFPYEIPPNFGLQFGKGVVHHPVSTSNPEAQKYFDQGLSYLYAFNHDAAFWSFKRASELDPNLAMAYWGMALVIGSNINTEAPLPQEQKAYEISRKALQLSSNASDNEKAYIEALSKRYSNSLNPDYGQLNSDYAKAMKKVVEQFPDDLDIATLYSESLLDLRPWDQWDENKNPREGTEEAVSILESVLQKDQNHLGANHYYIHVVEASKHPERSLPSAMRLPSLAPNAGHILHMPSHIYNLIGDQHAATLANLEAAKADQAYMNKFGLYGNYLVHYYTHVLHFLAHTQALEGNYDESNKTAEKLALFLAPHFGHMPHHEFALSAPFINDLRFHKWESILKRPLPSPEFPQTTVIAHFARAMAYASLGCSFQAEDEEQLFQKKRALLPPSAGWGNNPSEKIMAIADLMLKARIADRNEKPQEAIGYLNQAEALEKGLKYNEPPDWFLPILTTKGGILLRNGQYSEAEQVFRQDLAKHPRDGRALFGLLVSLKRQNKEWDAYWTEQALKNAWQYSTVPLNESDL